MSKRFIVARWILLGFTIIWTAYIIYHSCLDASASSGASAGIAKIMQDIINTLFPNAINETNIDSFHSFVRKFIGHFSMFVIDGFFLSWTTYLFCIEKGKRKDFCVGIIICLVFGLLLASTTEIIQLNVPGRSGEIKDVLIDYLGYLLGTLTIFIICLVKKLKANKNLSEEE